MALHVGHNCNPWDGCDVCGAKVEPPYRQRTDVCAMCGAGFTVCRCRHQLREWKEKQSMRDKLEDAFARLRHAFEADDYTPMEDVIEAVLQRFTGDLHLVAENSRLRAEIAALRAQVFAAVDDYANGRLLLFELCDRIGAPYPSDKKVVSLTAEVAALREALADIARGDYSDPLCVKTPEQRAREALAPKKEKP